MKARTDKVLVLGVDGLEPSMTKKFMDQGKMPNMKKLVEHGACREDLFMLCAPPTITPPLWTTLATGAYANTHGITCFWMQDHDHLDTLSYSLDSRMCKAEQVWNVTAEAGKKTLVWHWPGSSWPPTSDSPNLHVVDGTQPASVNGGIGKVEMDKMVVGRESFTELKYQPGVAATNGAGCIIDDLDEESLSGGVASDAGKFIGAGGKTVQNIILTHEDGELALDNIPLDICNTPIKPATGWANAPEGAKEFTYVTSNGLVRRVGLILQNADGVYDRVALYHSKKDMEPLHVLKVNEFEPHFIDEYLVKDEKVVCSRCARLMEVSEDGSSFRLALCRTFNSMGEAVWHPKSLNKAVIDNIGYMSVPSVLGGADIDLVNRVVIPSWEAYAQWQARALNYLIDEHNYQVIFSHLHNVDAMGHMFWFYAKNRSTSKVEEQAYQKAIEEVYCQTDRYVGQFVHLLEDDWTIFVTSDHGLLVSKDEDIPLLGDAFGCNVRVLEELGYTVVKKGANGEDLHEIDWEKTRAVATRGNHIWLNLKGRDPHGIVDPKDQYDLETEIIDALYSYRLNGKRMVSIAMRNKEAALLGMGGPECGDILYWLEEAGNRVHGDSLPTFMGYFDSTVSPIFIAGGKGVKQGYYTDRVIRQVDFAPTIAALLGVRMPAQSEGSVVHQILEDI